jgi:DNA mismatch endonuclease (patch repair protein)
MQLQRSRNTAPELALRRALHRRGLRYRLHRPPVAGLRRTPDIVFGPARTVVEVRGCFWHGCEVHGTRPRANAEWWAAKLDRNKSRGAETTALLRAAGWEVVVVWEHEDPEAAAARVEETVRARRSRRASDL